MIFSSFYLRLYLVRSGVHATEGGAPSHDVESYTNTQYMNTLAPNHEASAGIATHEAHQPLGWIGPLMS